MTRRTIYYSGRVQGVGFRYAVHRLAAGRAVVGLVRNLSDGRVELILEGSEEAIESLLEDVGAKMVDYVRSIQSTTGPATEEFQSFEIR